MQMRSIVAWMVVGFAAAGYAQDTATAVTRDLASTSFFAFGGVGYAGVTSQGEKDFHLLMMQQKPAALESFEKLYATGDGAAKAYALAGIRELDRSEFDQLLISLPHSNEKISTMSGCLLEQELLTDVVARIKAGDYDLWIRRTVQAPSRVPASHPSSLGGWVVVQP